MIYAAFSDFSSFDFGVADPVLGKLATKTVAGVSRGRWTAGGEPSLFDARFLRVAGTARKGAGPGGRRTRGRCPGEPWRSRRCAPRLTENLASNISDISFISNISLVSFSECDYVDSIE
jgi:hypothetical protein